MADVISLDFEPFIETTTEEIVKNMEEQEGKPIPGDEQARDLIRKLSGERRFLVEENKKLRTANAALARDRGELAARILELSRERDQGDNHKKESKIEEVSKTKEDVTKEVTKRVDSITLEVYQTVSQQYSNFNGKNKGGTDHFNNAAQNIAEEVWELQDAWTNFTSEESIKLELGDLCWSFAMLCDSMKFPIGDLERSIGEIKEDEEFPALEELINKSMKLLGYAKKVHYHNRPLDKAIVWECAQEILKMIFLFCANCGFSISEILKMNIEKLVTRFPSGRFSPQEAHERLDVQ